MKVVEKTRAEKDLEKHDYRDALIIYIDDKRVFCVRDGESEDATLGRDFNDCHSITSLMEQMYEAGKAGIDVTFEYEEL